MNYYDGNTVTGLWNYAQHFAMSDNSFGTTFGPSAPGAINLASGDTGGVGLMINGAATDGDTVADGNGGNSLDRGRPAVLRRLLDARRRLADRAEHRRQAERCRPELGLVPGRLPADDHVRDARRPASRRARSPPTSSRASSRSRRRPTRGCATRSHPIGAAVGGTGGTTPGGTNYGNKDDYIAAPRAVPVLRVDRQPAPPGAGVAGRDRHRHADDRQRRAAVRHRQPPVRHERLRRAGRRDHPRLPVARPPAGGQLPQGARLPGRPRRATPTRSTSSSSSCSEINALEQTPDWSSTAVVISYDDSDGYYDHVYSGVHNPSNTAAVANPPGPQDFLDGAGLCGNTTTTPPLAGRTGRCGYGPRLPLLVISPWAQAQLRRPHADRPVVDHQVRRGQLAPATDPGLVRRDRRIARTACSTSTTSGGRGPLFLDPTTGEPYPGSDR